MKILLLAAFALLPLFGAPPAERPDLNGTWQLKAEQSELHSHPGFSTWEIEQTADSIHLIESAGDKRVSEFRCATDGKDCKVKLGGHAANYSLYYNGPILVELETSGREKENVVKRRLLLSQDGSVLTVEATHVSPEGKPSDKLVLMKVATK